MALKNIVFRANVFSKIYLPIIQFLNHLFATTWWEYKSVPRDEFHSLLAYGTSKYAGTNLHYSCCS